MMVKCSHFILVINILFVACVDSNEDNSRQIPKTTSAVEWRTPLSIDMVEESDGLEINEDGSIWHTGEGKVVLRTIPIHPSFKTFHSGSMKYLYKDRAIFSQYRERVHVRFRLTLDGGSNWGDWKDDSNLLSGEGVMWDDEPDSVFLYILSGSFQDRLYNGVQVEIVSEEINQGQKIIDLLRFNFIRKSTEWFEKMKRNREEAESKKNGKIGSK